MAAKKNYKTLLTECLNLRGKGGQGAHERILRLNAVYDDEGYREFCRESAQDPAEHLDQYVEDLCLTFLQLRTIHEHYPDLSDWIDGKLKTLYDKVLDLLQEEQESQPKEARVSYKALSERLSDEKRDVEYELQRASRRVSESESEIETLRNRIHDAEQKIRDRDREIAVLEGRISELERMSSREMAVA